MTDINDSLKQPLKRRGRKPKGGKIIGKQEIKSFDSSQQQQSVIVHMKCFTNQIKQLDNLKYTPDIECVEPFTYDKYEICNTIPSVEENVKTIESSEYENKLKSLNIILDKQDVNTLKSSCFWCTCPFETKAFFIPKNINDDSINAYGCFCSPECGLAYLLDEHIDESIKVERIFLLNSIYCPICAYNDNIKPALSPYYTLSKYLGNLSIDEFRKLSNSNTISRYTHVEKPITLSNPEFCEDHL